MEDESFVMTPSLTKHNLGLESVGAFPLSLAATATTHRRASFHNSAMNLFYSYTTGPHSLSRVSLTSLPLLSRHRTRKKRRSQLFIGWNSNSIDKLSCTFVTASNDRNNGGVDMLEECEERVEVIGLGSRKDAVLDFCSTSPFLSPVLRFWNILGYGSEQVQLQQKFTSKDNTPSTVEDFSAWQSSCKAVILVASAAYGSDHITALKVLSNVKSGNGFVVGIILKPFSFEGRRRQDEVKELVGRLQKQANFCIVLDTDTLLENDMVTLDEASRTTHNAVLMAMDAISILLSEKHIKLLRTKDNSTREIQLSGCIKIFMSYNEARIGFGTGHNVKTSVLQAINDCPFLGVDIKDLDGILLCVIASSGVVDCSDANNILHTVRAITKCHGEIILSIVHKPHLEANTVLATIIAFGCTRQQLRQRNGIFSSLSQHFPFIFNVFKKQHQQMGNSENANLSKSSHASNVVNPPVTGDMPEAYSFDGTAEENGFYSGKIQKLSGNADEEFSSSRDDNSSEEREVDLLDTSANSPSYDYNSEGNLMFRRELLTRGNLGPDNSTEVSKYGTNFTDLAASVDSISIFKLPVGIRHFEKLEDSCLTSNTKHGAIWRIDDGEKKQHRAGPNMWSGSTDTDFSSKISSANKGNCTDNSKKQGVLSARAAAMLESERDSEKKWSRVVEMKYRGGIYRGRTQGGLPEGKGRLLLGDGSIYDGMWRYGKRSGLGTFYFNNGDVFQGSWRDDLMHGKGWIYFHTGDRWFANFWKGKANGEGRFYSKLGDVFFGHFKDGWRHGHFLHINVDGTRSQELWDEGMLVNEKQLDPDEEVD